MTRSAQVLEALGLRPAVQDAPAVRPAGGPGAQVAAEVTTLRLSASQVQVFVDCQRKWAWKYVEGVEEPPNAAAAKGGLVHKELEKYLTGGAIDFTSEIGYIAASGLEHLPKPGTPGLRVEQEFHFFGPSGHSYLGYKDLETPGILWDHKTTSDLKWQKTPEDLKTDIQATLYAVDYFRKNPAENDVELRWVYYQTKNTKKSAVTRLRVNQTETWQQFQVIEKIAEQMAVASTKRALDLPPSINHCSAYGGCPHQGRCNLSPFEKMRSHVEQNKLTNLLKGKKNGAAAPAAAPAPAAAAPAATPGAFGPGGRFAGMAPPPAAPAAPAATPATGNKLLAKMRGAGAPAATTAGTPAPAPVPAPAQTFTLAEVQAALASGQTLSGPMAAAAQALIAQAAAATAQPTAPGQINPPEFQAPPAPPPAGTVAEAGAELAGLVNDPAAGAVAAPRGRTKKAVVPPTGLAVKIKTLFINCGPVGVTNVVDATQLIVLAKQRIAAADIADYRLAEYGQGPGMLALSVVAALDEIEGEITAVRLDTTTPEGIIVMVELMARAGLVVR